MNKQEQQAFDAMWDEMLSVVPDFKKMGPIAEGWQISIVDGHSGYGVYAHMPEYPEDGAFLFLKLEKRHDYKS